MPGFRQGNRRCSGSYGDNLLGEDENEGIRLQQRKRQIDHEHVHKFTSSLRLRRRSRQMSRRGMKHVFPTRSKLSVSL